jgi:hypothetical protein
MVLTGLTPYNRLRLAFESYQVRALLKSLGVDVESLHNEAILHKVCSHGQSHVAETDETHFLNFNMSN